LEFFCEDVLICFRVEMSIWRPPLILTCHLDNSGAGAHSGLLSHQDKFSKEFVVSCELLVALVFAVFVCLPLSAPGFSCHGLKVLANLLLSEVVSFANGKHNPKEVIFSECFSAYEMTIAWFRLHESLGCCFA
jgi:hypothetical protein